ncbi:MAG: GtrA family protein [Bacilli bacterium]
MIKKLFKNEKIRFLFVGGLNTIVGYVSYALLLYCNINFLIANTISTVIGMTHSYFWNKYFTFKSKGSSKKEIFKFICVYAVSYITGLITLFIIVEQFGINQYLAGLVNLMFTTLISWFGHKYFSFKKKEE